MPLPKPALAIDAPGILVVGVGVVGALVTDVVDALTIGVGVVVVLIVDADAVGA